MNRAKYYETLTFLAEVATYSGPDEYIIVDFALGFIPFENGTNMSDTVGNSFIQISRWLLDVADKNLNCKEND
jgi:hypothetical protein